MFYHIFCIKHGMDTTQPLSKHWQNRLLWLLEQVQHYMINEKHTQQYSWYQILGGWSGSKRNWGLFFFFCLYECFSFTIIIVRSFSSATSYDSKQACVWELIKQIVKLLLLISFWFFCFWYDFATVSKKPNLYLPIGIRLCNFFSGKICLIGCCSIRSWKSMQLWKVAFNGIWRKS